MAGSELRQQMAKVAINKSKGKKMEQELAEAMTNCGSYSKGKKK